MRVLTLFFDKILFDQLKKDLGEPISFMFKNDRSAKPELVT